LAAIAWKSPEFGVVHNLDGVYREKGDTVPLLRDQIDHPVQWTTCQKTLHGLGITQYVELGPGKVLTGLGKRIVDGCEFSGMDTIQDLRNFETKLEGKNR
jgi:[acyl-carrier-protein] S-malonyltransferase